jgi:hypothetical protein
MLGVIATVLVLLLLRREHAVRADADQFQAHLQAAEKAFSPTAHLAPDDRLTIATRAQQELAADAGRLRKDTQGPLWSSVSWLPGLHGPMHATRQLALVTDQVSTDVVPTYLQALTTVSHQHVTALQLGPLAAEAPALDSGAAEVVRLHQQVEGIGATGNGSLDHAVQQVLSGLDRLGGYAQTLSIASHVAPDLLGTGGPRVNLVVLTTPVEQRGTGGLVGGYVVLDTQGGKVAVRREGTNGDLFRTQPKPVITLDPQFEALYGGRFATRDWRDSNLSPDFTRVGAIWGALYKAQTGQRADGVLMVTPELLGRVLSVTGPVTLPDGTVLTGESAAGFLERGLYVRWPKAEEEPQRDAFQREALRATVKQLLSYSGDPLPMLSALGRGAAKGQVRLFATQASDEALLAQTPLGGSLSSSPGPFLGVIDVNADGSKLDAYLQRALGYSRAPIAGDAAHQLVSATVKLTNNAPPTGLPEYVTFRADLPAAQRAAATPGAHRVFVSIYLSTDAVLQDVTLDGHPVQPALVGHERDHLIVEVAPPVLNPGQSVTLRVRAKEKTSDAQLRTITQATAVPDQLLSPIG